MRIYSPPSFIQRLYPGVVWKINTSQKEIYFTFDDGPHPVITPKLLELLDDWGAKATFFCSGSQAQKHPEIYQQIMASGHATGNHTFSHLSAWKTTFHRYLQDIDQCRAVVPSGLFRPPYGHLPVFGLSQLQKDYKVIMWSLLSYDFDNKMNENTIIDLFSRRGKQGQIWVFHDNEKAGQKCLNTLPHLLKLFTGKGFTFKKIKYDLPEN